MAVEEDMKGLCPQESAQEKETSQKGIIEDNCPQHTPEASGGKLWPVMIPQGQAKYGNRPAGGKETARV